MSSIFSTTTYKNFQIVITEHTPSRWDYDINNPFTAKTVKRQRGLPNSTAASIAATAAVDALDIISATAIVATALGHDTDAANAAILALMTAGYVVLLQTTLEHYRDDGFDDTF